MADGYRRDGQLEPKPDLAEMARDMIACGVQRIHVLAWRDLDDPEAGGSELHADEFMRRWQEAGLDILHRTSRAVGHRAETQRHGYRVIRRGGRYDVFPRVIFDEVLHRMGPYDAVVEIWNGVPWLTPFWCRKPRLLILHHVHDQMWNQTLPAPAAWLGRKIETAWAPRAYRNAETVTLCEDSQRDLLDLGWRSNRLHIAHAGVDPFFSPGGSKTPHPSAVAVGRLAPVKRFLELLAQCRQVRAVIPSFELTIVGEGPQRSIIEQWIGANDAGSWVHLTGRIERTVLRDLYRKSWLILSASLAEGWGLTLTEAAGCSTPAIATDIGGHRSAVIPGRTGDLLALQELGRGAIDLLNDEQRRLRMGSEAQRWARTLSWDDLAADVLRPLHYETLERS